MVLDIHPALFVLLLVVWWLRRPTYIVDCPRCGGHDDSP